MPECIPLWHPFVTFFRRLSDRRGPHRGGSLSAAGREVLPYRWRVRCLVAMGDLASGQNLLDADVSQGSLKDVSKNQLVYRDVSKSCGSDVSTGSSYLNFGFIRTVLVRVAGSCQVTFRA